MSENPGFINNFRCNFTFQNRMPPRYPFPPPAHMPPPEISDEEFIRKFKDGMPPPKPKPRMNKNKIWKMKADVIRLLGALHDIKLQEETLSTNYSLSDEEWQYAVQNININKKVIKDTIIKISKSGLNISKKLVCKRRAKRLRLKRKKEEKKEERKEWIRQNEENSLRIDENLQQIKDAIQKAKQKEEAKFQADIVLKEVMRKKHDAKKSIVKLEALVKLRKARENTAKGKGQIVSDSESCTFQENVDRLKSLWEYKLASYEKEEAELRAKLDEQNEVENESEIQASNMMKWRKALFGGKENPQVDFNGDLDRFIGVRADWDQYIDDGPESTPIPIGWVFPNAKT
ncbi:virulence factor-related M protein-like [Nymphalis io]|uniref:virulence factor-related M protein-like n=1 Tax=Inachis io TaxID=171585 RepID=UPI002167511D|nr:virulence factor-related M protein-like [Nymphalis io]